MFNTLVRIFKNIVILFAALTSILLLSVIGYVIYVGLGFVFPWIPFWLRSILAFCTVVAYVWLSYDENNNLKEA